jgi:chromosomal replication initiation ATPase DnaA
MTRHELLKEEMSDDLIESSLETLGYGFQESKVESIKSKGKKGKESVSQGGSNRESFDRCLTFLSHYYELSLSDIKGPKRTKEISLARQCIMYILKLHMHRTYEKIGKEFGRGHASVIYAVETFTAAMQDDAGLKQLVEKCVKYGMG